MIKVTTLHEAGEVSVTDKNKIVVSVVSYNDAEPVINVQSQYIDKDGSWRPGKRPALPLHLAEDIYGLVLECVHWFESK